ncbi:LOW QUALITY PROTEIN: amyloid-beta A4 precursor protein-binding family B member 3 [Falco biarmicus]|uniref:LOW QUALITY PROTEIN: amyloid-beta A4 precursor protein-binding family B member 3 n=1 Tax=Falco cherrug TaxID=345164 RepID=UPI0024784DE0|nr:LOW QUALITY PROTEIN: amyloid-beta A4 precursor protein-binding family B member 3 [Falco cherrug]XP_056206638.1 LOW QUALITY PROTEIN: amyloid-beta A4 precursor protein-binding family B member 3 [Falco biarmicus]
MLGKDYMLAIVLVNCDDNLWSDQSLETDPDLPPGWRKICDSLGTYYWHVSTGTTQWQHPAHTTCPGGHLEADGEETLQGMDCQAPVAKHLAKNRPIPSPMASLSQRTSLPWQGDDFQHSAEPGSKCFAVRLLGSVEIPEEDLAPGKSSIAVNNCIQQLSNSKGQGSGENQGEGQDLVMILKKDTMSLVDPLDHSLIHRQPILNIRVWGVGCNNGRDRDFAFVASDKDTCVLKCHVFHCNVPAKGIAKALHEMCSKIVAERAVASSRLPCATTLEPVSTEDLPLQVDILEAVRQSMQTYKALYIGSLPVPRAMGMDVLNKAIEKLTRGPGREHWMPSLIHVSDTAMRVHPAQVGRGTGGYGRSRHPAATGVGQATPTGDPEDEEAAHIWECQVRYVTFLGVGRDAHTFALIVDTGRCFQCTAFWCEPDAGTISEAVQAACMVSGSRNPPNSPALWDTCGRRRRQGLGTEEGKAEGLSGMPNPGGRQGREGADPSEPHPTPRHTQPPSDATLRPRLVVCGPAVVSPCSSTPRPRPVPRVPTGAVPEVPGAAAPAKVKGATGRGWAGPTAAGDAATGAAKASGSSGGAAGPGARRRGLFSLLEAFRLRRTLLHSP